MKKKKMNDVPRGTSVTQSQNVPRGTSVTQSQNVPRGTFVTQGQKPKNTKRNPRMSVVTQSQNVPRGTFVTQGQNVPRGTSVTQAATGGLKTDTVNVRLPPRLAVYLRETAKSWGETPSEYVRGLIARDMRERRG